MPKRPLSINMGSPSLQDSRDDGSVHIHIQDAISGEVLADLEIPAGRFWRLAQGSYQTHIGFVSDHLERVGKKMRNEQIKVDPEVYLGKYKTEEVEPAIQAWLDRGNQPAHWETVSFGHHNWGWSVTGRWWEEVTEEEVQQYVDGYLI